MILLPFSGGIDSTAHLWHYAQLGREIITFKLNGRFWSLSNAQERAERQQARLIIRWIKNLTGQPLLFREIDIPEENPWRKSNQRMWNIVLIYAALLAIEYDIDLFVMPENKYDLDKFIERHGGIENFTAYKQRQMDFIFSMSAKQIEVVYPFYQTPKREVAGTLPSELLALTISCHYPIPLENEWRACGVCMKCQESQS